MNETLEKLIAWCPYCPCKKYCPSYAHGNACWYTEKQIEEMKAREAL